MHQKLFESSKGFLKTIKKDVRINLFNEGIICAWIAKIDIQIVLEPYGCASYIVGYIRGSINK